MLDYQTLKPLLDALGLHDQKLLAIGTQLERIADALEALGPATARVVPPIVPEDHVEHVTQPTPTFPTKGGEDVS